MASSVDVHAQSNHEQTPLLGTRAYLLDTHPRLVLNPCLWAMGAVLIIGSFIGGYLLYMQGM